jgi:hypothetical protein
MTREALLIGFSRELRNALASLDRRAMDVPGVGAAANSVRQALRVVDAEIRIASSQPLAKGTFNAAPVGQSGQCR